MARHTKHNNNSPAAGVPDISNMPDDIKNDIVALATMVNLMAIGGTCMFYAFTGKSAFAFAGIEAQRVVGGMMYRAGHDEMRDVVAFVGPGNVGCFHNGMFHGHQWLQVGDTLVDFSPGQWKSATEILVQAFEDGLGAVDWVVEPPEFFWGPWNSFMPPASVAGTFWTPALGRAVYTGFRGTQAEHDRLKDPNDEFMSMLEMAMRQQLLMAKRLELRPRVDEWRRRTAA